jgi:hypothetical protein
MQDCFREHPDVYGAELEPDEEEDGVEETPTRAGGEAEEVPDATAAKTASKTENPSSAVPETRDSIQEETDLPPKPLERPLDTIPTKPAQPTT